MSEKFTYHDAAYESPAESFSIPNPYNFSPSSSQYKFTPSDGYNFSEEIPDSEVTGYQLLWDPDSQFVESSDATLIESASEAASNYASPFETSNFAAPAAFATSAVLNYGAQNDFRSDLQGNSVAGHSSLSAYQAESNLQTHNLQNSIASTVVGLGAMFGPEGLAAGLLAGSAISSYDFTSPVSAPSDTGETVTSDQVAE